MTEQQQTESALGWLDTDKASPEWMLHQLAEAGANAAGDYDDTEEVLGYLGWKVERDGDHLVLTVEVNDCDDGAEGVHRWLLQPID